MVGGDDTGTGGEQNYTVLKTLYPKGVSVGTTRKKKRRRSGFKKKKKEL